MAACFMLKRLPNVTPIATKVETKVDLTCSSTGSSAVPEGQKMHSVRPFVKKLTRFRLTCGPLSRPD